MHSRRRPNNRSWSFETFWVYIYIKTIVTELSTKPQITCYFHSWWRHQMENFPRNWPIVRGIHRSPVNSLHKGQWRGALMFSLICVSINGWVNNREAGDLRRYRAHYDVIVMYNFIRKWSPSHIEAWTNNSRPYLNALTRRMNICLSFRI